MNTYKGVIFDLDGTLLDTLDDLTDSVNEVLASRGFAGHTPEVYKQKIGRGFRNLLEVSVPKEVCSDSLIDEILPEFLDIYDQRYMNKTRPYPGIDQMLDALVKKDVRIGVNSNKRTDYTNALVDKFFERISFYGVFGERSDVPKKPDPSAALEIAGLMDLNPECVLYIGDSKTDMQTGKNAGMDTAGVLWGFRGYEELNTHGAVHIVKHPHEIIDLFAAN